MSPFVRTSSIISHTGDIDSDFRYVQQFWQCKGSHLTVSTSKPNYRHAGDDLTRASGLVVLRGCHENMADGGDEVAAD